MSHPERNLTPFQLRIISSIVKGHLSQVNSDTAQNSKLMRAIWQSAFAQIAQKKYPVTIEALKTTDGKLITQTGILEENQYTGNKANIVEIELNLSDYPNIIK